MAKRKYVPIPCRNDWHKDPLRRGSCPSCCEEDTRTVQDKARKGLYNCKLAYGEYNSAERAAYNLESGRLYDRFFEDLLVEYDLVSTSRAVQAAQSAAWEEGHSAGYAEVALVFDKYARIVKLALAERK